MLSRNAITLALLMICSVCAGNQLDNEAATMPDSEVAIIKDSSIKGFMFNESRFVLRYFDGTEVKGWSIPNLPHGRIKPGRHTLGVQVNWGAFCHGTCPNNCYSGIVLKAEAGRKYSYDIEKNEDEVNVVLSDETGAVAAKALCESFPYHWWGFGRPDSSNTPVIKSVIERLERESKEGEIQDKAE